LQRGFAPLHAPNGKNPSPSTGEDEGEGEKRTVERTTRERAEGNETRRQSECPVCDLTC